VADIDELGTAKTEADRLTTRILELRDAYYERDELLVSDAEYDQMMRRLEELERMFPELQGQDSPTQTVGGRAQTTLFDPVTHRERMLSLDNVFSIEEFLAWAVRVEKSAGRRVGYLCELKIDGLAINLRYENGRLVTAGLGAPETYSAHPTLRARRDVFRCGEPRWSRQVRRPGCLERQAAGTADTVRSIVHCPSTRVPR
jgi:hypothetical protein